jgi:hypothetical protein
MIAPEWRDVDLGRRQICVQRSDWNGQVTSPAALDSAIRLLDQPLYVQSFGDILETGGVSEGKING